MLDTARQWLDPYSTRPAARLVVWTLVVAALACFAFSRMEGVALLLPVLWAGRDTLAESFGALLERHPWLVLGLPLLVILAKVCIPLPAAPDDLLRHIAVSSWPGGYRDMYDYVVPPPNEMYPMFDAAVGRLAAAIGPLPAMWAVIALSWTGFCLIFLAAARRGCPAGDARGYWTAIVLVLVLLSQVATRLTLARPEMFLSLWALAGLLPVGGAAIAAWVAAGLVLGGGYWLAPLYFPAVLLLGLRLRTSLLLTGGMGLAWLALWGLLTGSTPLPAIRWMGTAVATRLLQVPENATIFTMLPFPGFVALLGGTLWALGRPRRNLRLLALAGYFALSNQLRYIGIIAPLMGLFVLSAIEPSRMRWPAWRRLATVFATMMLAISIEPFIPRLAEMPRFRLPPGSVVLTPFDRSTFAIPFNNPGTVRVAPGFEAGSVEMWVQRVIQGMDAGRFDCAPVVASRFTHVAEVTLTGAPPPCLQLVAVENRWRLWRVVRAAPD